MRTWYAPLSILDNQRVLGQHREIHALLGSLKSPWRGYQNHPVTKLYQGEHRGCLIDYHERTLDEMLNRGWHGHKTPLSPEDLAQMRLSACGSWDEHAAQQTELYPVHGIDRDLHELAERWVNESKPVRNLEAATLLWQHAAQHASDQPCYDRIWTMTQGWVTTMFEYSGVTFADFRPRDNRMDELRKMGTLLQLVFD